MAISQILVPYSRIQEAYEKDAGRVDEAVHVAAGEAAAGDSLERARLLAAWNNGMGALRTADRARLVLSSPQNALASRLQSVLAQKSFETQKLRVVEKSQTVRTATGNIQLPEILEVKFDNEDFWGWLKMSWKFIFKPTRHSWNDPPPQPQTIPDDAVVAIFSDWGTGLYGAPVIASSVGALGRCDVAMHLGDTYYSGGDKEIHERLVGSWPKCSSKTLNRTLNGNHEMYSGGQGYFTALSQAPFLQPASAFALETNSWLLICLDTAYQDFDLVPSEISWVNALVSKMRPEQKVILFSHHQPFSQLDSQGPKLQTALLNILESGRVHAWFFGHEHRLVQYDSHPRWGLKARCVGHGGFPSFRDDLPGGGGKGSGWIGLSAKPGVPAVRVYDGPNPFITDDPDRYSPHGFVVLDFKGKQVFETYYSPDAQVIEPRTAL